MANNLHGGRRSLLGGGGGAVPFRSQDGLSTRAAAGSDEIQLRIDPMQGDLDEEIGGLRKQVRLLRNVAQEIETEAKFQNEFLNQLQMTLMKAQAGVKNNMRRLSKSIVKDSNHVIHVVIFAIVLFFIVYLLVKVSRR